MSARGKKERKGRREGARKTLASGGAKHHDGCREYVALWRECAAQRPRADHCSRFVGLCFFHRQPTHVRFRRYSLIAVYLLLFDNAARTLPCYFFFGEL